jgi:hypothetical protein
MAADQRYCLSCGARRGEPRAAEAQSPQQPAPTATTATAPEPASRPADVSPLAAVIGIALLGGMLLIGVLIGRGAEEDPPQAQVVTVGESSSTSSGGVASDWPPATDGFTVQLTTVSKDGATPESVDAAREQAVSDGAIDAAVLDSDLYSSLPPGNYVIYSGVYTDRRSAEVALKGLSDSFPSAAVVEVAGDDGGSDDAAGEPPATDPTETDPAIPEAGDATAPDSDSGAVAPITPEAGGESEIPPAGTDQGGSN